MPPLSKVLPAGNYNGSFNNVGSNANFWTITESGSNAYNRNFDTGATMNQNTNNKNNGNSVRLVKEPSEGERLDAGSLFLLLYRSYRDARRNKRNTRSQLRFESDLEHNLLELAVLLESREYAPLPSACFINELPVKREVIAADFRDRVVHHLLCSWLFPVFERLFIYDSYSCRKGKGTLFGINRVRGFVRRASDDFRRDCWVLRLDIKGFFMHIDKSILYDLIIDGLNRCEWSGVADTDLCRFLVHLIVFADPLESALVRSHPYAWDGLPKDKSLKYSGEGKGLPIGNLTSQLFANIYLNPLDHFVKRELKIECYGRYVDDMVLVHSDKSVLLRAIESIRRFLSDRLLLELHPNKIRLQPVSYGFSFLGQYILPYRVYPCRRLRRALNTTMDVVAYYGQLAHLNGTTC